MSCRCLIHPDIRLGGHLRKEIYLVKHSHTKITRNDPTFELHGSHPPVGIEFGLLLYTSNSESALINTTGFNNADKLESYKLTILAVLRTWELPSIVD